MTHEELVTRSDWETMKASIVALAEDAVRANDRETSRRQGSALRMMRKPSSRLELNIQTPVLTTRTPAGITQPPRRTQDVGPPTPAAAASSDRPPATHRSAPSLITPSMAAGPLAPCGHPISQGIGCHYCKANYDRLRRKPLLGIDENGGTDLSDYAQLQRQLLQMRQQFAEADERNRRTEADLRAQLQQIQQSIERPADGAQSSRRSRRRRRQRTDQEPETHHP